MKHLLFGVIFLGLGVWGVVAWWNIFGLVMRGLVPFALLLVGMVAIIAGYRTGQQADQSPMNPLDPRASMGGKPGSPSI